MLRDLPSGKRRITSFWFSGDVFGLAERGKFVYTTQAVTAVTLYRIPVNELKLALLEDGHLQFQFLVKVTHEFREVQRQKVALTRGCRRQGRHTLQHARAAGRRHRRRRHRCRADDPLGYRGLPRALAGSREPRNPRGLTRRRLVAIPGIGIRSGF